MPRLVLLPGMDGTGDLFRPLTEALPTNFNVEIVHYPRHERLSYSDLLLLIEEKLDPSQPYFLLAESFSSPLAIQIASSHPQNLQGLIVCAGFVRSPICGWRRKIAKWLSPVVFRFPLPDLAIRWWLIDRQAPTQLLNDIRSAIESVSPDVLSFRLRSILDVDVQQSIDGISLPVFYIRGASDRLVKDDGLNEMLAGRDQTEIKVMNGPHLLLQCRPVEAAMSIAVFTERLKIKGHKCSAIKTGGLEPG